jgi:type I restriction enzyme M protein
VVNVVIASKQKIAENGEYNLTGERYRVVELRGKQKWPTVRLGDVCEFKSGFAFKSQNLLDNQVTKNFYPVVKIGSFEDRGHIITSQLQYHEYSNDLVDFIIKNNDIIIAMTGATVGKVAISQVDNCLLNQRVGLIRNNNRVLQSYLKAILFSDDFYNYCQKNSSGGAQCNIAPNVIKDYYIPLPSLEIQQEIVAEIEGYQKVIDGCRELIVKYEGKIKKLVDGAWGE